MRPALDDQVFGLEELPAAFAHMRDGRHFGKIVVEI
ncbi:MAG: zinc-binding dehydrogenase [Alphaproteobacteria bacterium]|nr:zinc-binding dehydrogenase [Alphaproteobacteria bacterium]